MKLRQYKVGLSSYFIWKKWGLPYFTQVWDFFPLFGWKSGGVPYKHTHTHTELNMFLYVFSWKLKILRGNCLILR